MTSFRFIGSPLALVAALCLLSGAPATHAAPQYRIVDAHALYLGNPAVSTGIVDINNRSDFVANLHDEFARTTYGYIYRDGALQRLTGAADGINERGDAISTYVDRYDQIPYAYLNTRDGERPLPMPSGTAGTAWAINHAGHVVGYTDPGVQAFFYDGRTSRYLLDGAAPDTWSAAFGINDADAVVGRVSFPGDSAAHAFVHEHGVTRLLSDLPSTAWAINNAGQVAGVVDEQADAQAFLYDSAGLQRIGPVNPYLPVSLNDRGWVVGTVNDAQGDYVPFLYRDGARHDLQRLLTPRDASRWTLTSATDINDAGVIVGSGRLAGQYFERAVIAIPVPEPAGAVLMLAGLGVLGVARRARVRRAA